MRSIIAVFWVSEGIDRCMVGYLPPKYDVLENVLEGRLCQITEVYASSNNKRKQDYMKRNKGVCRAVIVDKFDERDGVFNNIIEKIESDDSSSNVEE